MKDRFRFLPIFFSLGLHGLMASFLIPSFQEVVESESVAIAVLWENPIQGNSQEIQPTHTPRHSRPRGGEKQGNSMTPHPPQAATSPTSSNQYSVLSNQIVHKSEKDKRHLNSISEYSLLVSENWKKEGAPKRRGEGSYKRAPLKKSHQPLPKYPWISRKRGQEGRVSLLVQTDGEGQVIRVTLHKSSGYSSLDHAALTAAKEWIISDLSRKSVISISFRLNR